jgi:SSS family solute:Na+ symporter
LSALDDGVFVAYLLVVLAVGVHHFRKNRDAVDYYVGGRSLPAHHVGLSIVATDVGGGFSIGLGGLGFTMGLSGSWLLFTGWVGAWLAAVLVVPRVKAIESRHGFLTYPDFLRSRYSEPVALLAAVISGIGYAGFTGAQILAGGKLASATVITEAPWGLSPLGFSLWMIASVTVLYTVIGGLKAVVYTDSIQWIVLLLGLIGFAIPASLVALGGWSTMIERLPEGFLSLSNVRPVTFINWMVTIVPIWLVAMTLYQRIYACRNQREAQKAWLIAGLLEYPTMAFTGVFLGMCARVAFPEAESEMGLPLLIRHVLPVGVTGIVMAAYFSAIMSTADSCLMAASGNFVNDIVHRYFVPRATHAVLLRLSQLATLLIGITAVLVASRFERVLDVILYAYSFMVSGLFIPTLGALFWKRSSSTGAFWGMLLGGGTTVSLQLHLVELPSSWAALGLDPSLYGMTCAAITFATLSLLVPEPRTRTREVA